MGWESQQQAKLLVVGSKYCSKTSRDKTQELVTLKIIGYRKRKQKNRLSCQSDASSMLYAWPKHIIEKGRKVSENPPRLSAHMG